MMWDGLFLPCIVEPVKHLQRLMTDRRYRSYCLLATRYGGCCRYTPQEIRVRGKMISVPDAASFLSTYREVFAEQVYRFEFASGAPRILDLGANIGLSVLYFKQLFPDSLVTAYEADPAVFGYLEKNIRTHGLGGVKLVQGAVWHEAGVLDFHAEGGDGGRIVQGVSPETISVPAYDIREILRSGEFDVLKMDIEGAEGVVFQACRGLLDGIRYIFMEYHSTPGSDQQLHTILDLLAEAGFRYYIEGVHHVRSPLSHLPVYGGFDLQLNISAWRDRPC